MYSICAFECLTIIWLLSQSPSIILALIQSGPLSQSEVGWPLLLTSHQASGNPTAVTRLQTRGMKETGKGRQKERVNMNKNNSGISDFLF